MVYYQESQFKIYMREEVIIIIYILIDSLQFQFLVYTILRIL